LSDRETFSHHIGGADAAASAPDPFRRSDPPVMELSLWPHRSLSVRGWRIFLALLTAGLSVPLFFLVGSMAAWGMLPFLVAALLAVYWAMRRNFDDAKLTEELRLWPDLITVERREPRGAVHRWHANPFWVQPRLLDGAHIEKYLTIKGGGREIELGAFLSPGERERLYDDLCIALSNLRPTGQGPDGAAPAP
jgi:uncharacterized membrane protein